MNHYDILGVAIDATEKEIRSAYRKKALKLHPDKNLEEDTTEKFKDLQTSFSVLSDPEQRARYDKENKFFTLKNLLEKEYYEIVEIIEAEIDKNPDDWQNNKYIQYAVRDTIRKGDKILLKFFLSKNFNVNTRIEDPEYPEEKRPLLYFAARQGYLSIAELLVERKADTRPYSPYHQSGDDNAIKIAVKKQNERIVDFLLEKRANPSCVTDEEQLPLLALAAQLKNEQLVESLLKHGASMNEAILAAHQKFERDGDHRKYQQTLKMLFDHAFGLDLPKDAQNLNFLKKINIEGIQFAGISVYGKPITHEMLRECQIEGCEKSIVTVKELEQMEDSWRSQKLLDKLSAVLKEKNGFVDNGIVNLIPLVRAVQTRNLRAVSARLEAKDADPNSSEEYSPLEPIYFAAKKGYAEIIDILCAHPKFNNKTLSIAIDAAKVAEKEDIVEKLTNLQTINALDEKGYSKLHRAIESEDIEEIKKLLTKGANVNLLCGNGYPLTIAASKNNEEIIALLLEKKANPNLKFLDMTALDYATELDTIRTLIPAISKDNHFSFSPWYSTTLFKVLKSPQCIEILNFLQAENADLSIKDKDGNTLLHHLLNAFPSIKNQQKEFCQHLERFNFLIENGINVNHQNMKGDTAIHVFLKNIEFDALPQLYVRMIDQCIKKKFNINTPGENGATLLHIATAQNNLPLVEFLVMRGADIHAKDDNGCTPLHIAAAGDPVLSKKGFHQPLPSITEYFVKHTNVNLYAVNGQLQMPMQYSKVKCAEEIKKNPQRTKDFEWLNVFYTTQGILGVPSEIIKKPAASDVFSDSLKEYKKLCKTEPDFEKIFKEYKISPDDLIWVDLYRDEFSHTVMKIPVKLNGHVYDFESLMKIYFKTKQDPFTGQMFNLSDIEPAFSVLEEIKNLAASFKDKYAPQPLPTLKGNLNPIFSPKRKLKEEENENSLTYKKR